MDQPLGRKIYAEREVSAGPQFMEAIRIQVHRRHTNVINAIAAGRIFTTRPAREFADYDVKFGGASKIG